MQSPRGLNVSFRSPNVLRSHTESQSLPVNAAEARSTYGPFDCILCRLLDLCLEPSFEFVSFLPADQRGIEVTLVGYAPY